VEALLLRMDAIKMVNERLGDAGGYASDGTIGAVESLMAYEVFHLLFQN
jgi:predicted histidine transporter YuiF (NhaC family)